MLMQISRTLHPDSTLLDLPSSSFEMEVDRPLSDIERLFEQMQDLTGILLVEQGQYVGMISRLHFHQRLSRMFGREVFMRMKAGEFLKTTAPEPLQLPASCRIFDAAETALRRDVSRILEPIIVGLPTGSRRLLDVPVLLNAQAMQLQTQLDEHQSILNELARTRAELEQRVIQRTSDLEQVNQRLMIEITDRRRAEADLSEARDAAEAANRAKSDFLANMSHEIRTPMTAILGYAELLAEDLHTQRGPMQWLDIIRRNGTHLLTIINDILDISKIEAGKMTVECIACSPCQTLAEVASLMRSRAAEKHLGFDVQYDGPVPQMIRTDPTRLRQILINLVGNAIKFTSHGSVRVIARYEAVGRTPRMQFQIIDTGMGMTRDQLGQLFNAFTQADTTHTRKFGGTGLGLTISRHLARMLGGDVTVTSEVGHGSVFNLEIQAAAVQGSRLIEPSGQELPAAPDAPDAAITQLNGRILLAEDGPDNQQMISLFLRKAGAEVVVADNGAIAVNLINQARAGQIVPFDLILMDIQMPEMDGYAATAMLRQMNYAGPIIALTAHAMTGERDKCLQAGFTDFSTKPINRKHLLRTAHKHIAAWQAAKNDQARCDMTVPVSQGALDDRQVGNSTAHAGPSIPAASNAAVHPSNGAKVIGMGDTSTTGEPTMASASLPPITLDTESMDLLDDPDMRAQVVRFVEALPDRVEAIARAYRVADAAEVRKLMHQLKGAAGTYGLGMVSEVAALSQHRLDAGENLDQIATDIRQLQVMITRIRIPETDVRILPDQAAQ